MRGALGISTAYLRVGVSVAYLRVGVERDDFLLGVEQFAGVGDVDGRLLLVAREHPDLQPRRPQSRDGLRYAVLQPVLDPRRS